MRRHAEASSVTPSSLTTTSRPGLAARRGRAVPSPTTPRSPRAPARPAPRTARVLQRRFSCGGRHAHVMFDGWYRLRPRQVRPDPPSAVVSGGGRNRPAREAPARAYGAEKPARAALDVSLDAVICPRGTRSAAREAACARRGAPARPRTCSGERSRTGGSRTPRAPGSSGRRAPARRRSSASGSRPSCTRSRPVLGAKLDHGERAAPGPRIGEPDRLHRAERERHRAARGHDLDRAGTPRSSASPRTPAAPPSPRATIACDERVVLVAVERAVHVGLVAERRRIEGVLSLRLGAPLPQRDCLKTRSSRSNRRARWGRSRRSTRGARRRRCARGRRPARRP